MYWFSFVVCLSGGEGGGTGITLTQIWKSMVTLKKKNYCCCGNGLVLTQFSGEVQFLLSDWVTDWVTDWLAYWLTGWLTHWVADLVTDWLGNWLPDWVTDWLAYWLTGSLTGWLTDWLNYWLIGWLAEWLDCHLTDWLTAWLIYWLIRKQDYPFVHSCLSIIFITNWPKIKARGWAPRTQNIGLRLLTVYCVSQTFPV